MVGKVIVFGALGYIGKHLLKNGPKNIYPVTRNKPADLENEWQEADLLISGSLDNILSPGDVVINLCYSAKASIAENILMAENLKTACTKAGVSKLVHCSTAIVVGENPSLNCDESTECMPSTDYERAKYKIEEIFLNLATDKLAVCILRPTAVVGAGGQNLRKMLSELNSGDNLKNAIRSSVQGHRSLNLVSVKDIVNAILFLANDPVVPSGVYNCSADDDPDNHYDNVENIIRSLIGKPRKLSLPALPSIFLNGVLAMTRSGSARVSNRNYSAIKLASTGFKRSISIRMAVEDFVRSEMGNCL
jgi:nucleoside-diphosphate-sugar epimerase